MNFNKTLIVKIYFSLVVIMLCCATPSLFSQVTAGSVPAGTSILYNVVDLNIDEVDEDNIAYFDIDGDGSQDIQIWFVNGNLEVDGAHLVTFFAIDNSFSFCINPGKPQKTTLYELGDTLCTSNHEWGVDSIYEVGCMGGWFCPLDTTYVHDKYLAYRKNATGEMGWIKVSMHLYTGSEHDTIAFKIDELLVLYVGTSTHNVKDQIDFGVSPNPTLDGIFEVRCPEKIAAIELFNSAGQHIKSYLPNEGALRLPEDKGLYIVRVKDDKGLIGIQKIVRM
jgi:hypothetical protein